MSALGFAYKLLTSEKGKIHLYLQRNREGKLVKKKVEGERM